MEDFDVMAGLTETAPQVTPNAADDALLVKFYIDSVEDRQASKKEGRPVFKDMEMIDIRVPGSRNNVVRVAREADKQRNVSRAITPHSGIVYQTTSLRECRLRNGPESPGHRPMIWHFSA